MSDIVRPNFKTLGELQRSTREPLVRIERGWLSIETGRGHYNYDIEMSRTRTPGDIVEWLRHLLAKNWFTGQHARDFIEATCVANHIPRR